MFANKAICAAVAAALGLGAAGSAFACNPTMKVYNETGQKLRIDARWVQVESRGWAKWSNFPGFGCEDNWKTVGDQSSRTWKFCNPTGLAVGQKVSYKLVIKERDGDRRSVVKTHKRTCPKTMRVRVTLDAKSGAYKASKY